MNKIIQKIELLKNNSIFNNISWLFIEKVIRMAINMFIIIWLTRYLGPEQFGLFSYVQSFVGLFIAFAALGLDNIIIKELVKHNSKMYELITTGFWLKLAGAFFVIILIIITINFISNDNQTNLFIFIISITMIFQSVNVFDFYFQSQVKSKFTVYAKLISLIISSFIKISLILNEAPLILFVYVILLESLIFAFFLTYYYIKYNSNIIIKNFKFNKNLAISLLKDSWPLILTSVVISIYMKIDQVMIKEILDNQAVGQYAAASILSEAWYFIPVIICSSFFPAIINSKDISEKVYYDRLQKLFNLMVWLSIAIAISVTFINQWLVDILYGIQYSETASVLLIHIWTGVFVFLGVASGKWYIIENLQILYFWRVFFGMVINIILNLILIPKYGIQGAAYAILISQVVAAYLFDLFNNKTRKIFYMKTKALILGIGGK